LKDSVEGAVYSGQEKPGAAGPRPTKRNYIYATGFLTLLAAGASAWMILQPVIDCNRLAPLTVIATLTAFLISICFRQMGRYPDKRSRWILLLILLIAAGTLFEDFRYVRHYRDFCDQLQQQMRQPEHQ
jgi:polyferredoxin